MAPVADLVCRQVKTPAKSHWLRNPSSWLVILLGAGWVFAFFRYAPRSATFCFVALALRITYVYFRDWAKFRRLGFRVVRTGRDSYKYEELGEGEIRGLPISGEMRKGEPMVLWIPVDSKWDGLMPGWAIGRRDEIAARIRSELGSKRVEIVDSNDT